MHHGSIVADLALIGWIGASIVLFAALRPRDAVAIVVAGAVLFLPERYGYDLPGLPPIDKHSIASVSALIGACLGASSTLRSRLPTSWVERLIFAAVLGLVLTVVTNREPLVNVFRSVRPMSLYDTVSLVSGYLLRVGVPIYLGRAIYRTPADLRRLAALVVAFGLAYAGLALIEIRLSPQLHIWVYGYHQHSWLMVRRLGGWRPVVFMQHGLAVAMFLLTATILAGGLARSRRVVIGIPGWPATGFLACVFVACRSFGSMLLGFVSLPVVWFTRFSTQARVAALIALLVLSYPTLRIASLVPTDAIVTAVKEVSPDRAGSLAFRFENEDALLDHALGKPLFGWGSWGRNLVWTSRGQQYITDSYWILILGQRGVVGCGIDFVLLLSPIFMVYRLRRVRLGTADRYPLSAFAVALAMIGLDLLLNAMLHPLVWLMAGAVIGATQGVARQERRGRPRVRSWAQPAPPGRGVLSAPQSRDGTLSAGAARPFIGRGSRRVPFSRN